MNICKHSRHCYVCIQSEMPFLFPPAVEPAFLHMLADPPAWVSCFNLHFSAYVAGWAPFHQFTGHAGFLLCKLPLLMLGCSSSLIDLQDFFIFWGKIHSWFYVLQISPLSCGLSFNFSFGILFCCHTSHFQDFLFCLSAFNPFRIEHFLWWELGI